MKSFHNYILNLGVFLLISSPLFTQNTWTNGNATGIWNDAGNWSAGIPLAGDDVIFDATSSANIAIDINATVNSISINSGYTGTITQNAGITIDVANTLSQADGTFTGGDSYIDVNDTVSFSGGIFTSTSNELRCGSSFEITAAMTFNHNNGTLLFDGVTNANVFDINSTLTLYNLTINKGNNNRRVAIGNADIITVDNALTLTNGVFNSNNISDPGKIQLLDASTSVSIPTSYDGGTAILLIDHARTLGIPANTQMLGLELTDASAVVNLGANVDIEGPIILTNGTIDDQGNNVDIESNLTIGASGTYTSSGTIIFRANDATIDLPDNYTFNNLEINKGGNNQELFIASGDTITVSGTITLTNGEVEDGVIVPLSTVTHASTFDGGDATLYMNAAATTTLSTGTMFGILLDNAAAVVDCPTSGTLGFEGPITVNDGTFNGHGSTGTGSASINIDFASSINGGTFNFSTGTTGISQNFTYTAGTVNHNNGTVGFDMTGDRTLDLASSITLYDVEIVGNNNNRDLIINNSELLVANDLTLTNSIINTGNIQVDGEVSIATTFDGAAAGGTITFSSTNTSTLDLTAGANAPGIIVEAGATTTINGPTIGNTLTIEGILDMSGGSFVGDDGTVTINSTMNLAGTASFSAQTAGTFTVGGAYTQTSGTPSFTGDVSIMDFNGSFNLTAGTFTAGSSNFDVAGTFSIGGTGAFTSTTSGTILLSGDVTISGGSYTGGGDIIDMNGSFTQSAGTFDAGAGNMDLTNAFVLSGTGSFTAPSSGTLSLGDTYTQTGAGSTFLGSGGAIDLNDPFSVTDGAFTSSSITFTFSGASWTMNAAASAAFDNNSGTVVFDRGANVTVSLGAATAFNNVTVALTTGNDNLDITGSEMTIASAGTLTLTDGEITTGTIEVAGGMTNTTNFDGGTGRIHFTGGGVRTISITGTAEMPSLRINDANVTVNMPDGGGNVVEIEGNLDIDAGVFNARSDSFYVDGAVDQSGGTFTQTTGGIRVDESYVHSDGTFTGGAGELDFNNTFAQSGGSFTAGTGSVTITSTFTLSGTAAFVSTSSGTITIGSNVSITGGSYTGGDDVIDMNGSFSQSGGTFDAGANNIDLAGTFALSGTGSFTSNSSGTFSLGSTYTQTDASSAFIGAAGDMDLNNTYSVTDGAFTAPSGIFYFSGASWTTNATAAAAFLHNSGTVVFDRNANSSPTVSLGGNTTFNNVDVNLVNTNNNRDNFNLSASDMIIDGSGTLNLIDGEITTGTIQVQGDITNTSSFDGGTGLIHITGGAVRTISLTSTAEMPEIRMNDANATLDLPNTGGNVLTIEGDLDIDAGTINSRADRLLVSGALDQSGGIFTQTTGEIEVTGTYTQSNGTFTGGAGILDYNNTFSQSGGTFSAGSGNVDMANTFSLSGTADFTSTSAGTITVNSNVFITGGSYTGGGDVIDFNGTFSQTAGTFDAGAGNGDLTGAFILSGTGSFTANSSGTFTFGDTYTQSDATSSFIGAAGDLDLNDDLIVTDGSFTSASGTFDFSGSTWTMNATACAAFDANGGTIIYSRNNDITISLGDNTTFNNVTIDQTSGNGNNDDINITGSDIIIDGTGTLALNNGEVLTGTIQVQGDITNTSNFDGGTGFIHITGGGVRTINLTSTAEMPDLRVNDANVTLNFPNTGGNTLTIEGNLDIDDGTVNVLADRLLVSGTADQSGGTFTQNTGEIQVTGTYTQSNGTFTGGGGELDLNSSFTQSGGSFSAGAGDVNITTSVNISGTAAFTSSTAGTIDVGTSFTMTGGTYTGGADIILIGDNLTQSAGTFTAGSGDITIGTSLNLSNTADFTSTTSGTIDIGTDLNVTGGSYTGGADIIDIGDDITQTGGTIDFGAGDANVTDVITLIGTASFSANSSGTMTVGDAITQTGAATVFDGSSGNMDLNANLTVTDGTFTAPGGNFNFSGETMTFNAAAVGNFDANSGTIIFDRTNDQTLSIAADLTVNNFNINLTNGNGNNDDCIISGSDLLVIGNLQMIDGELDRNSNEEVEVRGTMDASGGVFSGGNAVLHVTNGAARTISFTEGTTTIPPLRVNDANAIVRFPDEDAETFTIQGDIDLDVGVLTARRSDFTCSNFTQDGGTFNGGTDDYYVTGNFGLNNGTYNSTSGVFYQQGATFYRSATSTFNNSSGTVTLNRAANDITVDLDIATTFFNVIVNQTNGNGGRDDINITDERMITTGLLTLTNGEILTGEVEVQGTISTAGGLFSGGTGLLNVTNGGVRSFTLDACNIPTIIVNDANVTITGPSSSVLTIEGGFTFNAGTVNGGAGEIDIDTDYFQDGGIFNGSTGLLDANDDFTLAGGTFNGGSGGIFTNDEFLISAGTLNAGAGDIEIRDNYTQTGGSFFGGTGNMDVRDNWSLNTTGSYTAPTDTLFVENTWDHNTPATFDANGGTVVFDGNANQVISYNGGDFVFHSVVINKTITAREVRPDSDLDINGNLTILDGRLELQNGNASTIRDVNLAGDYRNDGGANGLLERAADFTFDGNGDQTITAAGGETFYNMIVNKAGGEVVLNNEVRASNLLTMTNGNVRCDGNDMVIDSYSELSGGGAASYFHTTNSGMFRVGYAAIDVSSRTIHLGDASDYTPFNFQLSSASLASAEMSFAVTDSGHPNRVDATDYIERYWTYTPTGITGSINYNMSYTYLDADIFGDEANLVGAKFSGGDWTEGGSINTGTNTVTWTGETEFSDATAMDNDASPLPIELISFEAEIFNQDVKLKWETAAEINNDYFTIERSQDGNNFEFFAQVNGAGNSYDLNTYSIYDINPLPGLSYYRLSQTDFDGTHNEEGIISVSFTKNTSNSFKIYPNPTSNHNLNIEWNSLKSSNCLLVIYNLNGEIINEKQITTSEGINEVNLQLNASLPAGNYIIGLFDSGKLIEKRPFIIQ